MGNVITNLSMSLDGFVARPQDTVEQVFKWYFSGDTDYKMPGTEMVVKVSPVSAELLQEAHRTTGALVTGRRTFDITKAWGGRPPLGVLVFVVTHTVPQAWVGYPLGEGSPFTFVMDGVASAVEQAKRLPGTRTSPSAPPASCSSASRPGCSTRYTSTWCPSCSVTVSDYSTT